MKKDQVLSFPYQKIKYYKYALFVIILIALGIIAIIDKKNNTSESYPILGWILFFIVIAIMVAYKQSKELKFYNSLLALCKYILTKEPKSNNDIIEDSAMFIIKNRLIKYNKSSWEKGEKEIDEPYAISVGESYIFYILQNASDEDIIEANKLYHAFTLDRIKENQKKAISFKEKTDRSSENRYSRAEIRAKRKGLDYFEILDKQEENYKEKIKKEREEKASKEKESELKINFGFCPYCFKKIVQFTRKCPHCTADL